MFGEKTRKIEAFVLFTLLVTALFDAYIFRGDYGTITPQFTFVNSTSSSSLVMNFGPFAVAAMTALLFMILDYYGKSAVIPLLTLSIAIGEIAMGAVKMTTIEKRFNEYRILKEKSENSLDTDGIYTLSRNGKNVVVIFLDRAVNSFFPYAVEQVDGLEEQLDGFTYYPNTVSYGNCTTLASPAMLGGYEYTPEKINARKDELLKDKHNEAATLAPILFSRAGYSVTVTDSPFPNYSWRNDLSAFSGLENVKADEVYDKYVSKYISAFNAYNLTDEEAENSTRDGAVNFSLIQIMPELLRWTFYYYCTDTSIQPTDLLRWLSSLYYLREETAIEEDGNTYTFIGNELTHNPVLLNEELLLPATEDDAFKSILPTSDNNTIYHYSVFCAALKQLGKWFDWMRDNNIYDNTRIIIVSDHGTSVDSEIPAFAYSSYRPLLLVKDFASRGELKTDETFMTNADTIFISTENLEEITMVNPYTGNKLTKEKENGVNAYPVNSSTEWNAPLLVDWTQFTLKKENALHVEGNALDSSNWIPLLEWEE